MEMAGDWEGNDGIEGNDAYGYITTIQMSDEQKNRQGVYRNVG